MWISHLSNEQYCIVIVVVVIWLAAFLDFCCFGCGRALASHANEEGADMGTSALLIFFNVKSLL